MSVAAALKFKVHDLADRAKSVTQSVFEKLSGLKPISSEFKKKLASPDKVATEYQYGSGLKVFNINDKKSKLTRLVLKIPLPQTKERIPGTAHFLEHMLMTNQAKALRKDIMTWAEENGVSVGAWTSAKEMSFGFSLEANKLKPVMKFLAALYEPNSQEYKPETLEGERTVIQGERQGRENTPGMAIMRKAVEFFKGTSHYFTKNILGTQKDINSIQVEHLEEARSKFNIAESTLLISGPNSRVMDGIIHGSFKGIKANAATEKVSVNYAEINSEPKKIFSHHDVSDSWECAFYPDAEKLLKLDLSKTEKVKLLSLLKLAAFTGRDSGLVKELYKQKLMGSVDLGFDVEGRGNLLVSISDTDKTQFPRISALVEQELKRIAKDGLSLDQLKLVKRILENKAEVDKEDIASHYLGVINSALELEHDNWLELVDEKLIKSLEEVTRDEASLAVFNDKLKRFLDTYFVSAKSKTVETHHAAQGNISQKDFSSEVHLGKGDETANHYARPVAEAHLGKHFVRLPRGVSMKAIDSQTCLVNDKESNLARITVLNPNGMMRSLSEATLKSNDSQRIKEELCRNHFLAEFALKIFFDTMGASPDLAPEKLHEKFKEFGAGIFLGVDSDSLTVQLGGGNLGGVKKGAKSSLDIFTKMLSDPALLSTNPTAELRASQAFDKLLLLNIKALEESRKDRDTQVYRKFLDAVYAGDPERQSLDPDTKIKILKSIKLDDIRNFFRQNFVFDATSKILLNNSAQEAGISSAYINDSLSQLNANQAGKVQAKPSREYKLLEPSSTSSLTMSSDLDKTSAKLVLGNLTDNLKHLGDEDRMLLSLSMQALEGGGLSSGLSAKLRERGIYHWGMNYSLPSQSFGKVLEPQTLFSVSCECKADELEKVRQTVLQTLKEYLENGPKPEEISRIQHRMARHQADALKTVEGRAAFFQSAFARNKNPQNEIKLLNRPYDVNRAKELLRLMIKPENFTEVVDIPKSAQRLAKVSVKSRSNSVAALAELPAAA